MTAKAPKMPTADGSSKEHELGETAALPVLGVSRAVLFPGMRCVMHLRSERASAAVHIAEASCRRIAVFANRGGLTVDPNPEDLNEVGTLALVVSLAKRRAVSAGWRSSNASRASERSGISASNPSWRSRPRPWPIRSSSPWSCKRSASRSATPPSE